MQTWSKKWKEMLIWFSGYFSFIAFAIVGGYAIVKEEDEGLKATAKKAFIITLIFTALSAFLTLFNQFGSMFNGYYSSALYDFYSVFTTFVNIAKIAVYAVFLITTLVKKDEE